MNKRRISDTKKERLKKVWNAFLIGLAILIVSLILSYTLMSVMQSGLTGSKPDQTIEEQRD